MGRSRKTEPSVWERTFLINHFLNRSIRAQVEKRFPMGWQGRIVDIGCGAMPYRKFFDGRCREYVGCDQYPKNDTVVQCPADELSFEDDSFDAAVCFQVLEHVPRPWRVVSEAARVVKPGGIIIISAPFMFPHHPSPTDFYRFTHEGLMQLADEAGLTTEEVEVQCRSFTAVIGLVNWYNGMVESKIKRLPLGVAWSGAYRAVSTVPLNYLGLAADHIPMGPDHHSGNMGFTNYLLVARK